MVLKTGRNPRVTVIGKLVDAVQIFNGYNVTKKFRFRIFIALGICASFSANTVFAADSTPVVIEMMSSVTCGTDQIVQNDLQAFLLENPDAVLINCRTFNPEAKLGDRVDHFEHPLCSKRLGAYFKKIGMFSIKTPLVVVNGKYDANAGEISTAINMAKSVDKISKIALSLEKQNIHVEIPQLSGTFNNGELYLFTYAPTQKITITPQVMPESVDKDGKPLPKTEPFEGPMGPYDEFYLRPVIDAVKLGDWGGKEFKLSFPLPAHKKLEIDRASLSYIVVLTTGETPGDIIAVGELKSSDEVKSNSSLPQSEPATP